MGQQSHLGGRKAKSHHAGRGGVIGGVGRTGTGERIRGARRLTSLPIGGRPHQA